MRTHKYKALDTSGNWVFGMPTTEIPNNTSFELMSQYMTDHRRDGRQNVRIKPESLCLFADITDINGVEAYENDLILDRADDPEAPNGKYHESKLPIFFENGAFWVDESFKKDRTTATLLAEWDKPIICGNIFDTTKEVSLSATMSLSKGGEGRKGEVKPHNTYAALTQAIRAINRMVKIEEISNTEAIECIKTLKELRERHSAGDLEKYIEE